MNVNSAVFQISAPDLASCPPSELREFAFIGRSNVGKSSLINMLTNVKGLAKVSATPGHTQLINFFTINKVWTLVDLPGYGFAKTQTAGRGQFGRMISTYLLGRSNLAGVFVLIDSRHAPQAIDLEFIQWLLEGEVPFSLVFSKADKVKPSVVQKNIELLQEQIAPWCSTLPRVFTSSVETRAGRREILDFIGKVLAGESAFV
jgi:GTP-binding protein